MAEKYITIVETPEFLRQSKKFMDEEKRNEFINFIAKNPRSGEIVPGTGGVRKVRWGACSKGKRGGSRIIYYYHSDKVPLFLFSAYAKNHKENLSAIEKHELHKIIQSIIEIYTRI